MKRSHFLNILYKKIKAADIKKHLASGIILFPKNIPREIVNIESATRAPFVIKIKEALEKQMMIIVKCNTYQSQDSLMPKKL